MSSPQQIQTPDGKPMLSARKAAARLDCAPDYVSKLCREGKLRGRRIDQAWFVEADSIREFEAQREAAKSARAEELSRERKEELTQNGFVPKKVGIAAVIAAYVPLMKAAVASAAVGAVVLGSVSAVHILSTRSNPQLAAAVNQINSPFFGAQLPVATATSGSVSAWLASFFAPHTSAVATNTVPPVATGTTPVATSTRSTTPIQQTIVQNTYPVIERTIQTVVASQGVSDSTLAAKLNELTNELTAKIYQISSQTTGNATVAYAPSQRIDQLHGTSLYNVTVSGISGIQASEIPALNYFPATTSVAVAYGGTGNTSYAAGDILYATATDTLAVLHAGANGKVLKLAGGLPTWGTDLSGSGGSSVWATTTDNLAIVQADPTQVVVLGNTATSSTNYILEVTGNALFRNGITVTGSSTLAAVTATDATTTNATSTNFFATTASSTNLFASNFSLGNLSGFLKATAGAVSTALVSLTSDVTGVLAITHGGTGTSTAPAYGQLLVGNSAGGYDLVATSSLGITGGGSSAGYPFAGANNSTSTLTQFNGGLTSYASTTIGNGTQGGGLTVNGGATTTGNLLVQGSTSLADVTVSNSTSTNATSTNFFATTASSTNLFAANFSGAGLTSCNSSTQKLLWANGTFSCGTDLNTGGGGGSDVNWAFFNGSGIYVATSTNQVLIGGTATTTSLAKLEVQGGAAIDRATTTNATSTNFFATTASSTNLFAQAAQVGSLAIGNLSGFLKATAGVVSTAAVNLATDVTGVLAVSNGGTGWASLQSGTLLTGNGTGAVATTTVGTGLSLSGGALSNSGVLSVQQSSGSAQTGAVTLATSTLAANGQTLGLAITNTGGTFTFTPTLSGTLDNSGLTNSTISGVALGGSLFNLSATDGTLTFSGAYNGSTARTVGLNLATGNVWTAASTTFTGGLTVDTATTTSATTTNLAILGTTNTLLKTLSNGDVVAAVAGADYLNNAFKDWNIINGTYLAPTTTLGILVTASSTIGNGTQGGGLTVNGQATTSNLLVTGSTTLADFTAANSTSTSATTTNLFATTASSTNLFASNLSVANLSGFLKATAGAVSTALVNLTSDVTGVLPIANGGTNANSQTVNGVAYFDGTKLTTGTALAFDGTTLSTNQLLATGSTTLQNFTFTNATGTAATTTSFFATTASSTNLFASSAQVGSLTGAGLSSCSSSFSKLLWSGGNFTCGTDAGSVGTTEINWQYFNGSGVRLGTTTNQVLIGASATTTSAALEVAGSIENHPTGNPTLATATTTAGFTYQSAVVGRYIYSAEYGGGLRITDASNPKSLTTVGSFSSITTATAVAVSGKYAYVTDTTTGLNIIDVSNPSSPTLVGSLGFPGVSSPVYYGLAVSGKYAYVPDYNNGAVRVVDISNPVHPQWVSSFTASVTAPYDVKAQGKYLYIADQGTQKILIADISNPTAPALVGSYAGAGGLVPNSVYVSGKYAYVGDAVKGFYILNVANPASPTLVGSYKPDLNDAYYGVTVAGNYAYIADHGNLKTVVLDISSPASPALIGEYTVTNGSPMAVALSGKYAYVSDYGGGIKVVDINGLSTPAASIGSLDASQASISDNLAVGGDITSGGGLNVGLSGIFSRGAIAAFIASTTEVNPVVASFVGGNVGVGTTTPYARLTVAATAADANINPNLFVVSSSTAAFATSTLFSINNAGLVTATNLLLTGSTTLQNFTAVNSTTTNATSTNSFATTASSTNLFATTFSGGAATLASTLNVNGLSTFNGFISTASSTIGNGTAAGGLTVSGTATTTNLVVSGLSANILPYLNAANQLAAATVSSATGISFSAGTLSLASIPNSSLTNSTISGVALGGSLFNLSATDGTLIFSGAYNGSTARTVGLNLATGNVWTAASTTFTGGLTVDTATTTSATTTNLAILGTTNTLLKTLSNGDVVAAVAGADYATPGAVSSAYPFAGTGNSTSTLTQFNGGLTSYASTTIGDGTTAGGLTVNGNATTTGGVLISLGQSSTTPLTVATTWNDITRAASGEVINITDTNSNTGSKAFSITATTQTADLLQVIKNSSNRWYTQVNGTNGFQVGNASGNPLFSINPQIGQAGFGSGQGLEWNSASDLNSGSYDVGLSRIAAGVISINNGTNANSSGTLVAGKIGVGTTTPYAKLSVSGFTTGTPGIVADALSGFTGNLLDLKVASSTVFSVNQAGLLNTTGLTSYASSTIGNGSATGGLTVSGNATTTGNQYVAGKLGVALNNPAYAVDVAGYINTDQFSGFKQSGVTVLYASSTTGSLQLGSGAGNTTNVNAAYNTLVGYNAGNNLTSGANNTFIGSWSTASNANVTSGSHNIVIGYNIQVPVSTNNNQLNIGNILYGTNVDGSAANASTGQVGIGTSTPYARFSIAANGGDTNTTLFAIGSSTAAFATTTLLSVSNTGAVALAGAITSTATGANTLPYASSTALTATNLYATNSTTTNATSTNSFATTASSTNLFATTFSGGTGTFNGNVTLSGTGNSVGTITSGTWQGTAIGTQYGGLGGNFSAATGALSISGGTVSAGTLSLANGGTATTTFYSGGVVFSDGTKLTQSAAAANFFWDETNKRLGVGTSSPWANLAVNAGAGQTAFAIGSSTSTLFVVSAAGNVGIGTSTPFTKLGLTNGVTSGQVDIAYDNTDHTTLSVNASGQYIVVPSSNTEILPNANLWVCTGGTVSTNACPSGAVSGQGNIVVQNKLEIGTTTAGSKFDIETQDGTTNFIHVASSTNQNIFRIVASGNVGIGTSTPFQKLTVGAGGSITTTENGLTDGATIAIDWSQGNQQRVTLGGNRTITFSNYIAGQILRLVVCQDATGSRTLTWPGGVIWQGAAAPTLTTSPNYCDLVAFVASYATSTSNGVVVFGSAALNFP